MRHKGFLLSILTSCLLLISFYWVPALIFISFVPLFFACYKSNSAFKYGFITGVVFCIGLLYWILVLEVPVRGWLLLGMVVLFLYFGLIFALSMWFTVRLSCFHLLPIIWTAIEFIRSLSPEIGFPWGSVGTALIPCLQFIQFAEFTGLPGITFFVLLINLLLFYAIKKRELKYIFGIIILMAIVLAQGNIAIQSQHPHPNTPKLKIAIIQPNIAPETKRAGSFDYRLSVLSELSKGAGKCDLIIWPESAIPGYFNFENTSREVEQVVNSLNTPVIMGSSRLDLTIEPARVYNSCFFLTPFDGIKGSYDKVYLVPFGERFPFSEIFPILKKIEFGQGNFSQGKEYTVFELKDTISNQTFKRSDVIIKFSCLICFESIFSRIARRFVNNGAEFLVTITDDCWFGKTPGPYQHAQQAILRAIEYRIPIVRSANTGVSYFVDKSGEPKLMTDIFTQAVLIHEIELRDRFTFYAKYGDWFAWACVGIFLLIILNFRTFKSNHPNR